MENLPDRSDVRVLGGVGDNSSQTIWTKWTTRLNSVRIKFL